MTAVRPAAPIPTPTTKRPPRRKADAIGAAVEVAQIATRQKDDPHPIPKEESVLRAIADEETGS